MNFSKYAAVAIDLAIDKNLDYGIPETLAPLIKKGMQVEVTVRGKLRKGVVVLIKESSDFPSVLPIKKIIQEPLLDETLFELAIWMSKYYQASLGDVFKVILPASIRHNVSHKEQMAIFRAKSKEILQAECLQLRLAHPEQAQVIDVMLNAKKEVLLTELMEKARVSRSPIESLIKKGFLLVDRIKIDRSPLIGEEYMHTNPKKLNNEQSKAYQEIAASIEKRNFQTYLLHGITGSGKTEIYLQAIDSALKQQLGTIMLVPEISLTAQTIERFRSRFEDSIAILHSGLSKGERFDEWHRIRRGEAKIAIGARSAIFSPVVNLGLIIVDEEHDHAYKQSEESPCYHARDIAVMRGKLSKSCVILGSATPSLESYHNSLSGKYRLCSLSKRAETAHLPHVSIIDMKKEFEKAKGYTSFSEVLIGGIKKRYLNGEQTILFLNRRGYHTSQFCQSCGYIFKCPHCDLSLTFHFNERSLHCHLCDYKIHSGPSCPNCFQTETLKFKGVGTEQIERSLHALFPEIRTLRMDADTTRHKGSHEKIFRAFSTGKSDILIGTQMIAKGLHFPSVTLVAILNSDSGLLVPDFRASESVFQLITQVAGRSGRGHIPGEVIIQTHMPDNPIIKMAADQNFEQFFKEESAVRNYFQYPPFNHFIKYCFTGKDSSLVLSFAEHLNRAASKKLTAPFHVHPVTPAGHPKIKDHYRFQFLIRGPNVSMINQTLERLLQSLTIPSSIRLLIDVDPTSTFF